MLCHDHVSYSHGGPFMNPQLPRISLPQSTTPPNRKQEFPKKMPKPRAHPYPFLISSLALLFIHTHFSICNGVSVLELNALKDSEIGGAMVGRVCTQKVVGDCLTEPEMDSETNRRVLAMRKKYISYETLRRDLVPCARPGASYYNCHAVVANPYNRGCEVITGCARGINDIKT